MFVNTVLVGVLSTVAVAETIHGVVVFTRHGDRTTRMFPGYSLTNLGATQAYNSGQFYRQRYIEDDADSQIAGIDADRVNARQVWASAPNQGLLFQTANHFLQGLYPPLDSIDPQLAAEPLANGTTVTDPLNGYQFILIQGQPATNEDTIWIKGDDSCPVHIAAQRSYVDSREYKTTYNETLSFYSEFNTLLSPMLGAGGVTYENAYEVFDLLNVASIHNASVASKIDPVALDRLRYLADTWEWNNNFNSTQPERMIGGQTFIGGILQRMNETVTRSARSNKFQLFSGSYDTFVSFFGLTNLTAANNDFYGLPDYASTMAFELFTQSGNSSSPSSFPSANTVNDTLLVRFRFRNGTDSTAPLSAFPLFGRAEDFMTYGSFVQEMKSVAITSVGEWCNTCGSSQRFCVAANQTYAGTTASKSVSSQPSKLSNAAAGGIGAAVTLVVVTILGALCWMVLRRRKSVAPAVRGEKNASSGSESGSMTP